MLVIAALVAGGAFAQIQMSAGAGFVSNGGRLGKATYDKAPADETYTMSDSAVGGFLFFDATYAELSVGILSGKTTNVTRDFKATYKDKDGKDVTYTSASEEQFSTTGLDISLLGRYPVQVGKMTVSPLLGVGYTIVLGIKDNAGNDPWEKDDKKGNFQGDYAKFKGKAGDYSTFRIQLGAGADFDITDQIYFRVQGLGFYRLPTKGQKTLLEGNFAKDQKTSNPIDVPAVKGGFGGAITAAVGYRF